MCVLSCRKTDELLEFECCLEMDRDLCLYAKGVAYKYCVINSRCDGPYEYLHGITTGGNSNRRLMLDTGNNIFECVGGGCIHSMGLRD